MDASLTFVPSHVISGVDGRTTLMLRNLPNRLSEQRLVELIGATHAGQFDSLHMPMDIRSDHNLGYAFVNFASCQSALDFWQRWHGHSWQEDGFQSTKACAITYARKQVLAESPDAPCSEGSCLRTRRRRRRQGGGEVE